MTKEALARKERLEMEDYQTIRNRLMVRHAEIRERQGRVSLDLRHAREPLATHLEEQSIELENDEVLAALDESMRSEMERIEQALARLDQGEYGTCEHCGNLIPMRRLEALPLTTSCVACETARETAEGGQPAASSRSLTGKKQGIVE